MNLDYLGKTPADLQAEPIPKNLVYGAESFMDSKYNWLSKGLVFPWEHIAYQN